MANIICCACSAVNRVPPGKPAGVAKCGKCGARLFAAKPCDVSANAFDIQLRRSDIPLLVDVWAPWCGPCRMMAPAYEAAAQELEPQFRLLKLNSENEQQLAARLGVRGIPTMILFRGGAEIARVSGAMTTGQILAWVRKNAGAQPQDRVR